MANKEIFSEMANISKILLENQYTYVIPEFQRDFVWGYDEIKQLFDDFSEDTRHFSIDSSELEGYPLGEIVIIDSGNEKKVVDGQQRLTTLSLIAKAIYEILNEQIDAANDKESVKKISKKMGAIEKAFFILDDEDTRVDLRIKHDDMLGFGKYYQKLLNDTVSYDDKTKKGDILTDEDQNIDTVYSYAYEYLSELNDDEFQRFISYFKQKIKLIYTSAPTESKAFQLFEILNDRGKSLEPMDLIKNRFLKTLNDAKKNKSTIRAFLDDWQNVIDNLQISKKKKISSSTFLKQYLLYSRGVNVKTEKLFDYFKDEDNKFDADTILKFVSDMSRISGGYKEIEKGNYDSFLKDHNMFIIFKLLSIKQLHPVIMLFYGDTDEHKAEVLDALARFGAAVLFSFTQTNYIEKVLPTIIQKYNKDAAKNKDVARNNLTKAFEKEIVKLVPMLKASIETRNFVGKNDEIHSKALIILKFIELYFNENTIIITPAQNKKITVEHILSRNIDMSKVTNKELGFDSDKDRKDNRHRFGNLTLLYNTDNSSDGKGTYKDKLPSYGNSDFIMAKTLKSPMKTTVKNGKDTKLFARINKYEKQYKSKNGYWTKDLIDKRGKDLADLLGAIVTKSYD